ncbi:hypothetical protein BGW42_003777, partial [Actinomortierella wolfii]
MAVNEKVPTPDLMHMDVIDQMDQSAASVTSFVKKLREVDISGLMVPEKDEYLDIVGRYEGILERLLTYIGNEKPKFEYLQVAVTQKNPQIYEALCDEIDIETPANIYTDISELQRLIRDRQQKLGSKRRQEVMRLIVLGSLGVCSVVSSVLVMVFSLGLAEPFIFPIISVGWMICLRAGFFKALYDFVRNRVEARELTHIDNHLTALEKHLVDVREKCDELKQANTTFGLERNYYAHHTRDRK